MAEKQKVELEYIVKSSPKILYNYISSPSGLSEWFADDVNIQKDEYTFIWGNSRQTARLVSEKKDKFIRFKWLEEPENTYFEFKIELDDLTSDVILTVTDFADNAAGAKEAKELWDSQVNSLMHCIGS